MQDIEDKTEDCKRGEARIYSEVTVFVETFSAPSGEALNNNILISKTLDLSANGIQVVMDRPIHLGSILQLCISFGDEDRFYLVGEVRWVAKSADNEHFLVGFQLLESDNSHIENWKHKVSAMMDNPAIRVQ
ncbi:MAG TPA: PilZ domain-containing protein [Pseudomonadales bacterium]|nr:PilZ domain-containing protein [Pseudomonadales bacterium]